MAGASAWRLGALLCLLFLSCVSCNSATPSEPAGHEPPELAPSQAPTSSMGRIWISPDEIRTLPMSGVAWQNVVDASREALPPPNLNDQDSPTPTLTLARALVWSRAGGDSLYWSVVATLSALPGTEGDNGLARSRHLGTYVIAADIVGYRATWFLEYVRFACYEFAGGGRTVAQIHEQRPNNWGTHAGASRLACALFLGDEIDVARCASIFRGWCGDRSSYSGFDYGDLAWQGDPSAPVGINARDAVRDGFLVDGALPEEMRRGGALQFPPAPTGYVWEALQGAAVQAWVLYRAGYDVYTWSNFALWRALNFLRALDLERPADGWNPHGDDLWQVWVWHAFYGSGVPWPAVQNANPGKNMAWTDWTLGALQGGATDVFPEP